jgi:hypothetical protein
MNIKSQRGNCAGVIEFHALDRELDLRLIRPAMVEIGEEAAERAVFVLSNRAQFEVRHIGPRVYVVHIVRFSQLSTEFRR